MKRLPTIILASLIILILIACSTQPAVTSTDTPPLGEDPMPGAELSVSASNETPKAGETIMLNIIISPNEDLQQADLSISHPKEAELVNGPFSWQGALTQGKDQRIQVEIKILEWPLSEPIKVTLVSGSYTFWSFWPEDGQNEDPEVQRGTPEGVYSTPRLEGVEPSASVALTLLAEPENPTPGETTRFIASMTAVSDFSGVSGQFELPPEFQIEPGSNLEWHGNLAQGVEQTIEIFATATGDPSGEARFVLDLKQGEIFWATHPFDHVQTLTPGYRPEGQFDESESEPPTMLQDEDAPPPDMQKSITRTLPLLDFTIIERTRNDDEMSFTVFLFANYDITNGFITIILPDSLALVEGELEWRGDLSANDSFALELRLARLSDQTGAIEIHFSSDQGEVEPYIYEIIFPKADAAGEESEAVQAGTLYLSGRFLYDENNSSANRRGIYWARVQVYDDDDLSGDDYVCYDTTDSDGYWSCSGTASDPFDNTLEIYARVRAYNSNNGVVKEMDGDEYRFKTSNHNMSESGGTHDFGWWLPGTQGGNPQDGAFHIHRMGTYGNNTSQYAGSETPPVDGESHYVTFYWPDTDGDNSSEYGGWNIYIEGPGSTDQDQWDESVILHEYGHYLMDHFAVLGSVDYCHPPTETPPCGHSFNSHEDPQTAYIEGWANYYQSATKRYYGLPDAHIYIETTWSFNMETSWHDPATTWDDAESTIACIMWDLNDSPNDDQNGDDVGDEINLGHNENHNTFSNINPSSYGTPVDIHAFYTSFRNRHSYDNQLIRIFYEHGIDKDFTSPTGSININSGATYATSTSVTLNLSSSDPYPGTGVTQMRFLNSGSSWTSWQSYVSSKSWTLTSSNGGKTVYVQYKDGSGNSSSSYSDSIILDNVDPTNPTSIWSSSHTPSVWSGDSTVDVNWSGAYDGTSGINGYGHYWSLGPTSLPSTVLDTTGTSDTSATLFSNDSWYFHVRTVDNAGNWNNGAAHYGPFYIDTLDPTSSADSLPATSCSPFLVSWSGWDSHSGVNLYYVQYRVGSRGVWTDWLVRTSRTSAVFGPTIPVIVTPGVTYYFRVRAIDNVGNLENYPTGDGDTWTTAAYCTYMPLTVK